MTVDKKELALEIAKHIDPTDSTIQLLAVTAIIFGYKAHEKGWTLERTIEEGRSL